MGNERLTVPVGNVLVCDTGGNIEHDDTALAVDVVTITQSAKLFLASSVPDIELDRTVVLQGLILVAGRIAGSDRSTNGSEAKRVNFDTQGGHVLLLELASQVTLDEGGLRIIPLALAILSISVDTTEERCCRNSSSRVVHAPLEKGMRGVRDKLEEGQIVGQAA